MTEPRWKTASIDEMVRDLSECDETPVIVLSLLRRLSDEVVRLSGLVDDLAAMGIGPGDDSDLNTDPNLWGANPEPRLQ